MDSYILVVGSGGGEYILDLASELKIGQKHLVSPSYLVGGSGVNYSTRLIKAGFPTLPILGIGKDYWGEKIQDQLSQSASIANMPEEILSFITRERFFIPGHKTQTSTLIIQGIQRTAFTEKAEPNPYFYQYLKEETDRLNSEFKDNISVVMIGHIYADSPALAPDNPGECTEYVLDQFKGKATIFVNPGKSQINLGLEFWHKNLEKIDLLQLNMTEIKQLFNQKPLREIIAYLQQIKVTTIITLDQFGVLCSYRDGTDGLILISSLPLAKVRDSTGAGDALAAAVAASLASKSQFCFSDLIPALKQGIVWAAYACQHLGGSTNSPTQEELAAFEQTISPQDWEKMSVEIVDLDASQSLLRMLDFIAK